MVAAGRQCASRSTITPTRYALQSFQMHQEGWGAHLGEHTARGTWSLSGSKLHIKLSGTNLGLNKFAVIARDNTMMVACINKGGDDPFLCRTIENPDLVLQETGDSSPTHSRWLNVNKLSRIGQNRQNRQNGPSCQSFPSYILLVVQDPNMNDDAISLPWEDLDPYAFPSVGILGKWWKSCRTTHAGESF